jgi:hypothetical protein
LPYSSSVTLLSAREETDYRFDIILYTHRIFQMFEFPAMDILACKNKTS